MLGWFKPKPKKAMPHIRRWFPVKWDGLDLVAMNFLGGVLVSMDGWEGKQAAAYVPGFRMIVDPKGDHYFEKAQS